ncbi:MAG TPA: hypothetical protein VGN63_10145 [Flavisolibacter sp.]|jgi:hypothetical protein|nr:hypothetical protein [Flavisolibacter sp.]
MKRLIYGSALLLTMGFISSCDQHDTSSPDTSGAMPYNNPNVGVDTISVQNRTGSPNMSNDNSNKDQGISTTDSARNNQ